MKTHLLSSSEPTFRTAGQVGSPGSFWIPHWIQERTIESQTSRANGPGLAATERGQDCPLQEQGLSASWCPPGFSQLTGPWP